jgi:hypothetical protein
VAQRRNKPELYDVFSTAVVFEPESNTYSIAVCEWPGWWCNPEKDQLLQAIGRETDARKRLAMWERVQVLMYEDAARMRLGDYSRLDARRKDLQGFQPGPYMHSGTSGSARAGRRSARRGIPGSARRLTRPVRRARSPALPPGVARRGRNTLGRLP